MEELEEDAKKKKKKKMKGSKNNARLHRSLLHFSKALKKLHGHGRASANSKPSPASSSSTTTTAAASSLLSACIHPRTHSFSYGGRQRHVAARHRDDDDGDEDALAVNFRSLRIGPTTDVIDHGEDGSSRQEDYGDRSESEDDDVAAAAAKAVAVGSGGVAVVTLSVAPYEDFRRSMREMVDDAHARREVASAAAGAGAAAPAVDWDFMEELLFCYLQLNDRAVHKDILRAFTDTVAALRRRRRAPAPKPRSRRTRRRLARAARADGVDEAVASSWLS